MAGGDKAAEQRVRGVGFAQEFRMELARQIKRMVPELDQLDELAVRGRARENESGLFESCAIGVIELIPVPMAFVDDEGSIKLSRF